MPVELVDVLICGSGSAGLCAALWLAKLGVSFRLLERRKGPLEVGQADGVQCRTVEIFESFGLSDALLRESYHVLELAFWSQTADGQLVRTARAPDTPSGLSHQPHVILNQARLNTLLLDEIFHQRPKQRIDYGYHVTSVEIDNVDEAYPVMVKATHDNVLKAFRARYLLVSQPRSLHVVHPY